MATLNPFELLGDDDAEDPTLLLAAQQKAAAPVTAAAQTKKAAAATQPAAKAAAKLPSKPVPPAQAVRESRNDGQRGGRGGGRGRGGRGFNRDLPDNGSTFGSNGFVDGYKPSEDGDGGRAPSERRSYGGPRGGGGFRGGRRGGFSNGEIADGDRSRRAFDRRSATGRGVEMKRDGAGRGNWGTPTDETVPETEEPATEEVKNIDSKTPSGQDEGGDANKDSSPNEEAEKEPEEKEMTLEEYERLFEEKRKTLLSLKSEERKVELDKEFKSMQLLSNKKNDDGVFIKLGSEKDKRREAADKAKKSVSINEFLKPADGENYRGGGRGRGRGRGRGGYGGNNYNMPTPAIEDAMQFPALVAK